MKFKVVTLILGLCLFFPFCSFAQQDVEEYRSPIRVWLYYSGEEWSYDELVNGYYHTHYLLYYVQQQFPDRDWDLDIMWALDGDYNPIPIPETEEGFLSLMYPPDHPNFFVSPVIINLSRTLKSYDIKEDQRLISGPASLAADIPTDFWVELIEFFKRSIDANVSFDGTLEAEDDPILRASSESIFLEAESIGIGPRTGRGTLKVNGETWFSKSGGGGGGRGVNVLALDNKNGKIILLDNFDTWRYGSEQNRFDQFLRTAPVGTIVALAVADFHRMSDSTRSYLAQHYFSQQAQNVGSWDSWAMIAQKGVKLFSEQWRGNGSLSVAKATVFVDEAGPLDPVPPTGNVVINEGNARTKTVFVTLSFSNVSDNITEMEWDGVYRISNNGINWSGERSISSTRWNTPTLELEQGAGVKTAYAQFRDEVGNWSEIVTDTIIVDATPPTGTFTINNGDTVTGNNFVILNMDNIVDPENSLELMQFRNDGESWSEVEEFKREKVWSFPIQPGLKKIYARFRDVDGHWSEDLVQEIEFRIDPIAGGFSINGGDESTDSMTVSLDFSQMTGLNETALMRISNDGVSWSEPFPFRQQVKWALTRRVGLKNVFVQFKTSVTPWSQSRKESIRLNDTGYYQMFTVRDREKFSVCVSSGGNLITGYEFSDVITASVSVDWGKTWTRRVGVVQALSLDVPKISCGDWDEIKMKFRARLVSGQAWQDWVVESIDHGRTWSRPESVLAVNSFSSSGPAFCRNSEGVVVKPKTFYKTRNRERNWHIAVNISTDFGNTFSDEDIWITDPDVETDNLPLEYKMSCNSESVHFIWEQDDGLHYRYSLDFGETWSNIDHIYDDRYLDIAGLFAAEDGDIYMVWEDFGDLWFRRHAQNGRVVVQRNINVSDLVDGRFSWVFNLIVRFDESGTIEILTGRGQFYKSFDKGKNWFFNDFNLTLGVEDQSNYIDNIRLIKGERDLLVALWTEELSFSSPDVGPIFNYSIDGGRSWMPSNVNLAGPSGENMRIRHILFDENSQLRIIWVQGGLYSGPSYVYHQMFKLIEPNKAPLLESLPSDLAIVGGEELNLNIAANDVEGDSIEISALINGLTPIDGFVDQGNGRATVKWTADPRRYGENFTLVVLAKDSEGAFTSKHIRVKIFPVDNSPNAIDWVDLVGVDANSNNITKTGSAEWGSGGAASRQKLNGDGYFEFIAVDTTSYIIAGLSSINRDAHFRSIDFGIYLRLGQLEIYEQGERIGVFHRYNVGDRFSVERKGSQIIYRHNGKAFYVSAKSSDGSLLADVAIHTPGASVFNGRLVSNEAANATAVVWTDLEGAIAQDGTLEKTAGSAWGNGGAASEQILAGDGFVEFEAADTTSYVMAGFSSQNANANYTTIDFAAYFAKGQIDIRERGHSRGSFGSYEVGDKLRVERQGATIVYKHNGKTIYTSSVSSTGNVIVDAALHTSGGKILNAKFVGPSTTSGDLVWTDVVGVTVMPNGDLEKIADRAWGNAGTASLHRLEGDGYVEFEAADTTSYVMAGFSFTNTDANYYTIDFAAYFAQGQINIRETGRSRGDFGPYKVGDKLRVERVGSTIYYKLNGNIIYTSTISAPGSLVVDTALHTPGGKIANPRLVGGVVNSRSEAWAVLNGIIEAANGDLEKTVRSGWSSSNAISRMVINNDGYLDVGVGENDKYTIISLSTRTISDSWSEFAIYARAGEVYVYENRMRQEGSFGNYNAGDRFRIERVGNNIHYKRNGVTFYTSQKQFNNPLVADIYIFNNGGRVLSPVISDAEILVIDENEWVDVVGLEQQGNSFTKIRRSDWGNSGFASENSIEADGFVEYQTPVNTQNYMIGLSATNTNANFTSIDYALYTRSRGDILIYQKGRQIGGSYGTYEPGDRFRVQRTGETIQYIKNGEVFYTSTVPSTGPLVVDSAFHTTGSKVNGVRLVDLDI